VTAQSQYARFGSGKSVRRVEDENLLKGEGVFADDVSLPNQAHVFFLRSQHPHARIVSIDKRAASAMPGVLVIVTGDDLVREGVKPLPSSVDFKRADGSPSASPPRHALAVGTVRFVGEAVAAVIAETAAQARDAAEAIEVRYETLPAVTEAVDAIASGAPLVWPKAAGNVAAESRYGNAAAAQAAFAKAAHVVSLDLVNQRVAPCPIEPRAVVASYDAATDRITLRVSCQTPTGLRDDLCKEVLHIAPDKVRVLVGDVGGGFGMKTSLYPEDVVLAYGTRELGRPLKWCAERMEEFLAATHGRDVVTKAELALDATGRVLALRLDSLANLGAYATPAGVVIQLMIGPWVSTSVYDIGTIDIRIKGVLTHTGPTAAYRGAGRPEAIYLIERLIDDAARELAPKLGQDRIALRRRNLIPPSAMPYQTPLGPNYDCGAFEANLDAALELCDHAGFAARRAESERRGRLRGLGIVNAIEQAAGTAQPEYAEIRFNPSGTALLLMGTKNQGQGHETMFKQILHERLGLDPATVQFIDGDTDRVAFGMGTNGSRSTVLGGSALCLAADKVIAKSKVLAAHLLEAAAADIEFADGRFAIAGTDRGLTLKEVATAMFQPARLPAGLEPGLYENATYRASHDTYPNGCHACEVEIDPDTGAVALLSYVVVDDVGTVINPLTLKGQIHGGVAQGVGQILMEQVVWEPGSGQLLSATLMDYGVPRADTLCDLAVKSNPVPTAFNPLGAKGAGEAGTVGALPALMNAIMDALAPAGVRDLDMPATSERVWRALRAARAARG
jgi:aerobic carbon-monoxide dehydrogenase large subunit